MLLQTSGTYYCTLSFTHLFLHALFEVNTIADILVYRVFAPFHNYSFLVFQCFRLFLWHCWLFYLPELNFSFNLEFLLKLRRQNWK